MADLLLHTYLILFCIAFIAGCIDAIAGGGGLITLPALLYFNLSPVEALATNKLQSVFGSFSSTFKFHQNKLIDWRYIWPAFLCSLTGAMLGAFTVQNIPTDTLMKILPILLIVVAIYFVFGFKAKDVPKEQKLSRISFAFLVGFSIGFYDGFLGPGTGSFFVISFVALLGFSLVKATAHTKSLNFASNLGSLIIFLIIGKVNFLIGITMGLGAFLGARLGAHLAYRVGDRLIRPMLSIISILLALKLLFDNF